MPTNQTSRVARRPLRVRLHGGRAVHAARAVNSESRETACGRTLGLIRRGDDWLPPDQAVACGRCLRVLNREDAA